MSKNIYIFSAKYSPGLFKEFNVLGENLKKVGFNVKYILAKKYEKIAKEYQKEESNVANIHYFFDSSTVEEIVIDVFKYKISIERQILNLFKEFSPDATIVYNPHPLNWIILRQAKRVNPLCLTGIYLHEPYTPEKHLYGKIGYVYINIVDKSQEISIAYSDVIILPSPNAIELFKLRYPKFNGRTYLAQIIIPDCPVQPQERKFYTIAGGMNEAKGLDLFCELIEYVAQQKLDYQFQIVSSSNIQCYINSLSQSAQNITLIKNSKLITDKEMFQAHAESKAFFLLHTVATQSGAMTVAFMHGTPVIARDLPGFSQFIQHQKNSYLVPKNCSVNDLLNAMKDIEYNQLQVSFEARQTFNANFSQEKWLDCYDWLIKALSDS